MAQLRFLGASDSQGAPRWGCRCSVGLGARASGHNVRTRPAVVREDDEPILEGALPELWAQCAREHLSSFELADRDRWTGSRCTVPVYTPEEVPAQLSTRFGYLESHQARTPLLGLDAAERTFAGYGAEAIGMPHGFNGFFYAARCGSRKRAPLP